MWDVTKIIRDKPFTTIIVSDGCSEFQQIVTLKDEISDEEITKAVLRQMESVPSWDEVSKKVPSVPERKITESYIASLSPQADGRTRVVEIHVDPVYGPCEACYLMESGDNPETIMSARATAMNAKFSEALNAH
jgi:hypothetical protein